MSEINVTIILDKSGSMGNVRDATISGFNEYLGTLRHDKKNKYKISLTLFDMNVEQKYLLLPLKEVKDLDRDSYDPNGGTALYDAAYETIDKTARSFCVNCQKKVKNIVMILTDGQENSSRRWHKDHFRAIVESLQKEGNWTFVYMGANQDAWGNAQQWGFHANNVSGYQSTERGVKTAFAGMAYGTANLAQVHDGATMDFFSEENKIDLEKGTVIKKQSLMGSSNG